MEVLKVQNNALMAFTEDGKHLISVGESGKGSLISTRFDELFSPASSPRTSLKR